MRPGGRHQAAKSTAVWAVPLAVIALGMAAILLDPLGLSSILRGGQFDAYQRWHKRPYTDTQGASGYGVKVLDFTDAAGNGVSHWPLSHGVLARLVGELQTAGAAVVVVDAPLDAHDPLSPELFARSLPAGPENEALRQELKRLPSQDTELARALAGVHAVSAMTLTLEGGGTYAPKHAPVTLAGPDGGLAALPGYSGAILPIAGVQHASGAIGARNLLADGTVRAMPMVLRLKDKPLPSLDAGVLALLGGETPVASVEDQGVAGLGDRPRLARLTAGTLSVPLRSDGAMAIWFAGANPARLLSAAALDSGRIAAGSLAHTIVYIAPPHDTVRTPLGIENEGELHAEAMEDILLGVALRQPDSVWGEMVFLFFAGLAAVLVLARLGVKWMGGFAAALVALSMGFTWVLFDRSHVLFDSANASVWLALAFASAVLMRVIEVRASRTMLRETFAGALAAPALQRLARQPSLLKLDGESRLVTGLACNIRGYAQLAESFADDPAGLNRLIGAVMSPLIEAATAHGALVDCVTAGGFNAYWNVPLADPEHAIHACEAASRMTVVLAEVNDQLARERRFDGTAHQPIEIGIGLATGKAAAGAFPLAGRMHYAVNGDCTVLAERICAQSGRYGPAIILSDETRNAASRGFAFLEVDYLALGARGETVKLFALLGNPVVRASPKFRALATFHEHIFQSLRTQQWDKTRELIDQCRKLSGASQKLYDLHLARVAWFEQHPPGADWDGAFREAVQ